MPKLAYTTPPPSLMQELNEVAADAGSLATELGKANRLPADFPISQVKELLEGLQALPSGTGEGCLKPLEVALSRLPAIRKRYFETEEQSRRSRNDQEVPPLTRGMVIDQRLGALISSITTALDEYRALASVEVDKATDTAPSITIDASSNEIVSALEAAKSAEQNLLVGANEVERITEPSSANADSLKRQMRDVRSLLRFARVELRMPEFVPRWFRKIINGIEDYPRLLLKTSKGIQIGVDVARPLADAWHHFEHGFSRLVLDSIEQAARGFKEVAQKWEAQRTSQRDNDFAPFSIIRDKLGNGQFGPEMVVIPAGEFLMGSATGELNLAEDHRAYENEVSLNGTKRQMRISKSFAIGRYLVTRDEYLTYVKATGGEPPNNDTSENGKLPIVNVSWNDAQKYIAWLNKETGKIYRLPSEAEWEYSCRAGTDTRRCWGDAWNKDKANGAGSLGHTSPVDQYPPNMWGIHDMIGNVWEWCEDILCDEIDRLPDDGAPYVSTSGNTDRKQGSLPVRVHRGGAFTSSPRRLRCANRSWEIPDVGDGNVGFRLARRLDV
jgi:formylglycine-generating enzyme required for sulfatase activity